jgi:hypothetical protein
MSKVVIHGRKARALRDPVLDAAKRAQQARDYAAVRSGERSLQSNHLFGREIAQRTVVEFRKVTFD